MSVTVFENFGAYRVSAATAVLHQPPTTLSLAGNIPIAQRLKPATHQQRPFSSRYRLTGNHSVNWGVGVEVMEWNGYEVNGQWSVCPSNELIDRQTDRLIDGCVTTYDYLTWSTCLFLFLLFACSLACFIINAEPMICDSV